MSQATTLILLPQTTFSAGPTVLGERQPAAAYYLGNRNLQTLSWILSNFTGVIRIQATLAETPLTNDWFEVYTLTLSTTTQTSYYNLPGNFVWIRAVVYDFTAGVIQNIKVSY